MAQPSLLAAALKVAADDGDYDEPHRAQPAACDDRSGGRPDRVEDAAALMGLQRRQVYRLLDAFRAHGPDALISKRRGKPARNDKDLHRPLAPLDDIDSASPGTSNGLSPTR
jgi:hypothetical protein